MIDFGRAREIRLKSPAKINLSLNILGSRSDGFHEIETRVQQVSLFDDIRIRPASGAIRVSADCRDVPSGKQNLAYQAAAALREAAGAGRLGASIYLKKNIPSGAGLGGASGNAAAVLWALNKLWALKFPPLALSRIAAGVGSDVPLFLSGTASMCRGRGELVSRCAPLRTGWILLIKPPFSLPTPRVYGWMRKYLKKERRTSRIGVRPGNLRILEFRNDLELVVFERHPVLNECRDALLSSGARVALMSGSGTAMWGLFRRRTDAVAAAIKFASKRGWRVFLVRSLVSSPLALSSLEIDII